MEYREKHKCAQHLHDNSFIVRDMDLLRRYQPNSSLLSRSVAMHNGNSLDFEIVFTLLDFVTVQDILENRRKTGYVQIEKQFVSVTDKKKELPNMRNFLKLNGKISRRFSFKKRS